MPSHIIHALASARETRLLEVGSGVLPRIANVAAEHFKGKSFYPIADRNTLPYANRVAALLREAKHSCAEPYVIESPDLYAEFRFVEEVEAALAKVDGIPVAVGSGTINDLVKLASHQLGRPYLSVATAASMDGYTAFGASITHHGSKQTFACPAPYGVIADTEIIRHAPSEMGASGYADLLSKITAGADWILADALEVEAIDNTSWSIAQDSLHRALSDPAGVRRRDAEALEKLTVGLMLGGFAMQAHQSSRPASGAEHQFSHLWDMEHHVHNGAAPSHGFKVGVATLAVSALYEEILNLPLHELPIEKIPQQEPPTEAYLRQIFTQSDLFAVASRESAAKAVSAEQQKAQLKRLRDKWPVIREKLRAQLLPFSTLKGLLNDVGAPVDSTAIGIDRERLRRSFTLASFIRRRFTLLDVATRAGLIEGVLNAVFGPGGKLHD